MRIEHLWPAWQMQSLPFPMPRFPPHALCQNTSVVKSGHALAALGRVNASLALALPGVVAWVGPEDIPECGLNEVFGAPLFATEQVRKTPGV